MCGHARVRWGEGDNLNIWTRKSESSREPALAQKGHGVEEEPPQGGPCGSHPIPPAPPGWGRGNSGSLEDLAAESASPLLATVLGQYGD